MKYIILSILVLFSLSAYSQIEDTPLFVGKYFGNQSGGGSGYWQVTGNFTDESGYYDATSIQVGDVLFFVDAGIGYHLPVTTIVSASGSSFTIRVNNTGISGVAGVPNGPGGIYRANSPKGIWPFTAGLTASDQQTLNSFLIKRLNSEPVKRDTFITVPHSTNYIPNLVITTPSRFYNNIYISCKGISDTSTVAFLAAPTSSHYGVVYNIKNDSGLVETRVLSDAHLSNTKTSYLLRSGQMAQVRALKDQRQSGAYKWAVNLLWDSTAVSGGGSGINYVTQSSAPSDTTKFWLDNSSGAQEVWQLKQRVQSTWKTIQWYDPIGKVFSPLPPIYVLATGQSNMLGYNGGGGAVGDTVQDSRVVVWDNISKWVISRIRFAPYRTDGTYNNLAFHFAKKLAQNDNRIVRLILAAFPGQPIEYWKTGNTGWTNLTGYVSASGSSTKKFDVILWHQGESNGDGLPSGPACGADPCYRDSLYNLITKFQAQTWGDKNTKFIAGGTIDGLLSTHSGRLDVLEGLNSDTIVTTGFADAHGLTGDNVHFSNSAYPEFGAIRYWNAYKALPTLKYSGSGGGTTNYYSTGSAGIKIFKASHGYSVGQPVRKKIDGTITKGFSTAVDSFPDFVVVKVVSTDTVLVVNSGTYNIGAHGLQAGQIYYAKADGSFNLYPDTVKYVVPVFKVLDATNINVYSIKGYKRKIANDFASPVTVLDSDVSAFLAAASISNDTIKYALHEFVTSLKNNSLWTKMKVIYPLVGGSASTHSYNLKSPGSYQITWGGTVTHNYVGITGNGSTGFGNTGISSANLLTATNIGATWVSRNNPADGRVDWGATSGGANNFHGSSSLSSLSRIYINSAVEYPDGTPGQGIYTGWRSTLMQHFYKNGADQGSTTGAATTAVPTQPIYLLAWNNTGATLPSTVNMGAWMLHDSLTTIQKDTIYNITERLQRRLGRSFLNSQDKRVWTGGGGSLIENNLFDDLKPERHGVFTGTTDGSGDVLITLSKVMRNSSYTVLVSVEGTTSVEVSAHTKTNGTFKVRVFGSTTGLALPATGVTISYQVIGN